MAKVLVTGGRGFIGSNSTLLWKFQSLMKSIVIAMVTLKVQGYADKAERYKKCYFEADYVPCMYLI